MALLDPFYPVVESADWVRRLVGAGARLIQLRVKDAEPDRIAREIAEARRYCEQSGAQLIVNDYWRAAIEAGCDFIHLGQGDLDQADLPAIRKAGLKLGISTHTHEELERALVFAPDYIALGPIYPTILKQMPFAPQGLDRLGEWKKRIGALPLVAIGGLTLERALKTLAAGADSAAAVTAITLAADPETQIRLWLEATRPHNQAMQSDP